MTARADALRDSRMRLEEARGDRPATTDRVVDLSKSRGLGLIALIVLGCGSEGAGEQVDAPAPIVSAPAPAPVAAPVAVAVPVAVATDTAVPTPVGRIRRELGEAAVAVVEQADTVVVTRLRVIGARQANEAALTSDERIGGYPFEAPPVPLDPAARAGTVRQILEDASYDFVFARRCKNDDRLGVRFQRGQERVEFVLGVPCMHTAWYFRVNGEVQLTGAVLVDDAARAVIQLASDAGVAVAVK